MSITIKYPLLLAGLTVILVCGCKKDKAVPVPPSLTTATVTNITSNTATSGGTITDNGGAAITASGICWSKTNVTPTITDNITTGTTASGSFTSIINNLEDGSTYYVRAYATNSAGTGYGNVVTFNTTIDTTKVRFTYNGALVSYGIIISSVTGRKWMDRNLGASRTATASNDDQAYGDMFQWGRGIDGHQSRTSGATSTLSTTDIPGHSNFIATSDVATWYDWRNPQNDNLWQGSTGINNPCPNGWHVPTLAEWTSESIITTTSAYNQLKLTAGGYRWISGSITYSGTEGDYWSSTPTGHSSFSFYFPPSTTGNFAAYQRANGMAVRCIKD